jgi:hypothetical protein
MISPTPDPWTSAEPACAVSEEVAPCDDEDWDDSLALETDVVPALLPVGCNAYWGDVQYVWLRVDSVEDGPQRDEVSWIGRRREWCDWVIDETGWAGILDVDTLSGGWLDFLLREGVAPGQLFYVRLHCTYYQDYEGEWDMDVDWEVVARELWNEVEVWIAWETEFGDKFDV